VTGGTRGAGANGKTFWEKLDKTVQVAIVTVAGSILTALIAFLTTIITIELNGKGINDNSAKLDGLTTQAAVLKNRADDVERKLAQLEAPSVPVGTIVASLLTPPQFAKAVGDPDNFDVTKSKWIFAGQQPKTVPGTDWAATTGNAEIPDLREIFLRGQNNGRFPGVEEIKLGDYRPDVVGPHYHNQVIHRDSGPDDAVGINFSKPSFQPKEDLIKGWNIGGENLPKNVTVNYYIRINK
jgi:hypothetical protein